MQQTASWSRSSTLGGVDGPPHAEAFAVALDKVAAGAFDDTGGDRAAGSKVASVVQPGAIAVEVGGDGAQHFARRGVCSGAWAKAVKSARVTGSHFFFGVN